MSYIFHCDKNRNTAQEQKYHVTFFKLLDFFYILCRSVDASGSKKLSTKSDRGIIRRNSGKFAKHGSYKLSKNYNKKYFRKLREVIRSTILLSASSKTY